MNKPILGDDYLAGLSEGSASTLREVDEKGPDLQVQTTVGPVYAESHFAIIKVR